MHITCILLGILIKDMRISSYYNQSMDAMQTLVISLPNSTKRRDLVQAVLDKYQINWEFLAAVDGTTLKEADLPYDRKKVSKLLGFDLTNTEIGCFLSHRKAWFKCISSNQPTLIFEDDFRLAPNFHESINLLLTKFIDWDIARLQGLKDVHHQLIKEYGPNQIVINKEDPLGATAYLIKPRSAQILLDKSKQVFEPLDHFIEHRRKHGLRIIALKPYPVVARELPTTITGRPPRNPVTGLKKLLRSTLRWIDRKNNPNDPWFPK